MVSVGEIIRAMMQPLPYEKFVKRIHGRKGAYSTPTRPNSFCFIL